MITFGLPRKKNVIQIACVVTKKSIEIYVRTKNQYFEVNAFGKRNAHYISVDAFLFQYIRLLPQDYKKKIVNLPDAAVSLDPELIRVNPSGLIDSLGLTGVGGVSGVSGLWICNVICNVLIVTLKEKFRILHTKRM